MKHVFVILIVGILGIGCSRKSPTDEHKHTLELDDGEKWEISPEMSPYFAQSMLLIEQNSQLENRDYKAMAIKLDTLKNQFVSSCNMTGKSHDVLHSWLSNYLNLLVKLAKVDSQDQGDKIFKELVSARNQFNTYFDLSSLEPQ